MAGMPSINIVFKKMAQTFINRNDRRIVAIIVMDAAASVQGYRELNTAKEIPEALGAANKAYITQAFLGNISQPAKVLLYVLQVTEEDYTVALDVLATKAFDWLVLPPDVTPELAETVAEWIRTQRNENKAVFKAVLPHIDADDEAIVSFISDDIVVSEKSLTAAEYCSRIGGLLAGTPLSQSATYAALPEVSDVAAMTRAEMDEAVDAGKFLIFNDGRRVKVGRAVTTLQTTTEDKSDQLKKIKIVEVQDLIQYDLTTMFEDDYIGKYANSYDNKCVLLTAVWDYFKGLEVADILAEGVSSVEIDIETQTQYLKDKGYDVSKMTAKEIREHDTDEKVFLLANIRILDAIEDISLKIGY